MPWKARFIVRSLTLLCCACSSVLAVGQTHTASLTVSGAVQSLNGTPDNGNITIDFNGYLESVHYGQYSTPASLASALGAMFTRDYYRFGLRAKAGANQNQDPTVVTFLLTNGGAFGSLNVAGPNTSFNLSSSGFGSPVSAADTGTVTLKIAGTTVASTPYGDGSTATTLAQGLAAASKANSLVTVTADGANLYLQAKQPGTSGNYAYSVSAASSNPGAFPSSFLGTPLNGNLTGGANQNTQGGTVYSYSVANPSGGSGYDATGNLVNISDSVMSTWQYGYDSLNRLTSGSSSTGQYTCWSYDNFGNRTTQAISNASCGSAPQTVFYSTSNQITKAPSAPNGFSYDTAGNVTRDDTGANYLYDAEGRLCAVHGSQGMVGYQYNVEGRRVGKGTIVSMSCDLTANGYLPTNEYILDQGGAQMTELATDENGAEVWQHTNVTANGALIATYDTVGLHFYLNDALGTRRAQTDSAGVSEQTCWSLPFGDQLTCTQNLVAPTEHHFTGKERDQESGLDYFGARYYSSNMGRFSSPDPQGNSFADFSNPQSWNMYAYVTNNPLKFTDPTGMYCDYSDHDDPESGFDPDQMDYHSNSGECTFNNGHWIDDAYTHGGFDDYGRPDEAVSSNTNTSTAPQPTMTQALDDWAPSTLQGQVLNVWNWLDKYNPPNQPDPPPLNRFFNTTNCGPGGGGSKTGTMNGPCAVHDACYGAAPGGGISAGNNLSGGTPMTAGQVAQATQCNQALYDAARNHPDAPGSKAVQWWMVNGGHLPGGTYILFPGTEAKPW